MDPSVAGDIYFAIVDGVFVISWESVPQYDGMVKNGLNFQVALHAGGNIEIRWGDGNPPTDFDASGVAGIEDDGVGVAVYPTDFPFGNEKDFGVAASFPFNQCRAFVVTATSNYAESP